MKRIFFLLTILISLKGFSQYTPSSPPPGYTGLPGGEYHSRNKMDALDAPIFNGTPTKRSNQFTGAGSIGIDSTNHRYWFYSGGSWRELMKAADTTGKWYSSIYRSHDSVFGCRNGICVLLFKDSVGSGGGAAAIANTLPIFTKTIGGNSNLFINEPYIRDGGNSANIGTYNMVRLSTNVIQSDYTDGIGLFNWRDSAIICFGGWGAGTPTTTDTVRISTDGGKTFTFLSKLPYPVHTAAHVAGSDGYYYIFGADYLSTSTQQKTVLRTTDFVTWTVMTNNAAYGPRILISAWEWNGDLYVGGGQQDLTGALRYNDIYKSTDGGANWTLFKSQALASNGDSVMIGNGYCATVPFNRSIYRIMVNVYPATANKRCYKSLDGGLSWKRISDYPLSGVSYPSTNVWDGKLWVLGGYNGSANTSRIVYLDKLDSFHVYYNYLDNNPNDSVTATHASDLITYKDQQMYVMGNGKNTSVSFFRSNQMASHIIRDSVRINQRTIAGETRGKLRSIFGNNVKASTVTDDKMIHNSTDAGGYIGIDYTKGIGAFMNIDATPGTEFSDTLYNIWRVDENRNFLLTDGYYNWAPGTPYRLAVNGRVLITAANAEVLKLNSTTSSAGVKVFTGGTERFLMDFTNGDNFDGYSGAAENFAFRLSSVTTRFIPWTTGIPVDTTTYKPVVASSNGTSLKFADWSFLTAGISGLASASNLAGTGVGVFKGTVSGDAKFKRIIAGTNVTITDMTDSIKIDATSGGGSGTPAGNYGNVQINRNSLFDSPGSDSFSYTTSAGLSVKNKIAATDNLTINKASGDLTNEFNATGTANYSILKMSNGNGTTGANYSYMQWLNNSSGGQEWHVGLHGSNNINFYDATNNKTPLTIKGASTLGFIGINNTTPGKLLQITSSNNSVDAEMKIEHTGSAYAIITMDAAAGSAMQFGSYSTENYLISGGTGLSGNKNLRIQGPAGLGADLILQMANTKMLGKAFIVNTSTGSATDSILVQNNGEVKKIAPQATSGTYTPTLTNTTNVAASTAYACQYMRVGDVITVSGKVDIDPTAPGATVLRMDLPFPPGFGNDFEAGGTANSAAVAGESASISAVASSGLIAIKFTAVDISSKSYFFTVTYKYTAP